MADLTYTLIRSDRKTIELKLKRDGSLEVRAPWLVRQEEIERLIRSKKDWIEKHQKRQRQEAEDGGQEKLSEAELRRLAAEAKRVIPGRVAYYASKIGVTYGRITIRSQRTRWGSCSSRGNLNFNCLLMLAPIEVLDSVIVHELCHRKEMNHSARFYAEVLRVYPDYKIWNSWLKEHGGELMARADF